MITIRQFNEQDIPLMVEHFALHNWPKPASTFENYWLDKTQGERIIWLAFYGQ